MQQHQFADNKTDNKGDENSEGFQDASQETDINIPYANTEVHKTAPGPHHCTVRKSPQYHGRQTAITLECQSRLP
jgi:hypothetical protein